MTIQTTESFAEAALLSRVVMEWSSTVPSSDLRLLEDGVVQADVLHAQRLQLLLPPRHQHALVVLAQRARAPTGRRRHANQGGGMWHGTTSQRYGPSSAPAYMETG